MMLTEKQNLKLCNVQIAFLHINIVDTGMQGNSFIKIMLKCVEKVLHLTSVEN